MGDAMQLFTIGFTKKSAEQFFERVREAGVKKVIDVRLNNVSQLAGFSKKDDLRYFLDKVCGVEYVHLPLLAPEQGMLDEYKKKKGSWESYAQEFLGLMEKRKIEEQLRPEEVAGGCLLCSEDKPHQCHRRLVAEYLEGKWGGVEIKHL